MRVAACGDLHCDAASAGNLARALAGVTEEVDLVLLAGDLTATGEPAQAALLANACRDLRVPVLAVCGNHEEDAGRRGEIVAVLEDAGVRVLETDTRS